MTSSIVQAFFLKIQPNMIEQEKKQQSIYDLVYAETKPEQFSKIIVVYLWP